MLSITGGGPRSSTVGSSPCVQAPVEVTTGGSSWCDFAHFKRRLHLPPDVVEFQLSRKPTVGSSTCI